jgi:AcrR family transcriptional regulator
MGTKERRQREISEREQRFLTKAWELILQDGLLNLQMARVAEACDYATGTLYQHFASKEDLLVAIACVKSTLRAGLFERAARWRAPSRDRVFAAIVADMLFARHYPDYFRLTQFVTTEVIWGAASSARRQAALDSCRPIGDAVFCIFRDAVGAGDLDPRGLSVAELMVGPWTLCSGMHTLVHAEGMLQQYEVRDPYRLLMRHAHNLFNGYGWRPLFDPADDRALDALVAQIICELFGDLSRAPAERATLAPATLAQPL